jgi:thymidylate synthase (FAD)
VKIPPANGMQVELIDHMGSDLSVVNAARVSFHKKSEAELVTVPFSGGTGQLVGASSFEYRLKEQDQKLIKYLAANGHWSPFAHTAMQLRFKAPITVNRQLAKHQTGAVINEVSRRYVDDLPEFFMPDEWRKRVPNLKQGSSETESVEFLSDGRKISTEVQALYDHAESLYQDMIDDGVAPEKARGVLPLHMFTEWWWTGSLYFFARVANQRLDPHAQMETRYIAYRIHQEAARLFPVSWKNLVKYAKEEA